MKNHNDDDEYIIPFWEKSSSLCFISNKCMPLGNTPYHYSDRKSDTSLV